MKRIKNFLEEFGAYLMLMKEALRRPQNAHVFRRKMLFEMKALGLDSILIVSIISIFVGAAVIIQLILNLNNPIYPDWIYGFASRKAIMLEFSPTIISLILAGKCASRIASLSYPYMNKLVITKSKIIITMLLCTTAFVDCTPTSTEPPFSV